MQSNLLYNADQRPPLGKSILLSFRHVFAMFGATILVPLVVGLPVSVALFCSSLGTLIYRVLTWSKVPVYLGPSFAYIATMQYAMKAMGGSADASQTDIIPIGCVYLLVVFILHFTDTGWLDKLSPPIVIGPMIIVIGLGLSPTAVEQAGFIAGGDLIHMLMAVVTFLVTGFVSTRARGVFKIIPFLMGICFGYLSSMVLDLMDYSGIIETFQKGTLHLPDFYLPSETRHFNRYNFYFGLEALAILPVTFVILSEHIGDHTVLSKTCGRNFLKDPGLSKTIAGNGLATAVSVFLGGPANTTYGENTGVASLTRMASTSVISGAAIIAITLSFFALVQAAIMPIPEPVLEGMSLLLYGAIASNGLRALINNQVDFSSQRNLIITSAMMVLGLGGAVYPISKLANLFGTALSAVVGISLGLILSKNAKAKQNPLTLPEISQESFSSPLPMLH